MPTTMTSVSNIRLSVKQSSPLKKVDNMNSLSSLNWKKKKYQRATLYQSFPGNNKTERFPLAKLA